MSVLADQYRLISTMLLAGIVADLLLWLLKPQASRPVALRLFAFLVPLVLYLCYFLTLMVGYGMFTDVVIFNWSTDLWLGVSVMTGMASLVLSYLLVPPEGSAEQAARLRL
jgi:hypothetical protein